MTTLKRGAKKPNGLPSLSSDLWDINLKLMFKERFRGIYNSAFQIKVLFSL